MTVYGPYRARVVPPGWHDGDTGFLDVDLGFGMVLLAFNPITGKEQWRCRVAGINAPELSSGKAGEDATGYALGLLPPGTVLSVYSLGWDKYGGRWNGRLMLPSGGDFGDAMLAAGHAKVMR